MPTRIIRPGILDSDRVNALDWAEEVFYRRLMSVVDDHGLYDARPAKLRADLYPLKIDRVREADITRWSAACAKAGLILLYEAAGKPYLKVLDTRWQVRGEPKYPPPPIGSDREPLRATAINCAQPLTYADSYSKSEEDPQTPASGGSRSGPDKPGGKSARTGDSPGFVRFWEHYPSGPRKAGRPKCLAKWRSGGLEPDAPAILAGLARWIDSRHWRGGFVCNPHRFLNERFWENENPDGEAKNGEPDETGFVRVVPSDDEFRRAMGLDGTGGES